MQSRKGLGYRQARCALLGPVLQFAPTVSSLTADEAGRLRVFLEEQDGDQDGAYVQHEFCSLAVHLVGQQSLPKTVYGSVALL